MEHQVLVLNQLENSAVWGGKPELLAIGSWATDNLGHVLSRAYDATSRELETSYLLPKQGNFYYGTHLRLATIRSKAGAQVARTFL